jgi:hypothetical protein
MTSGRVRNVSTDAGISSKKFSFTKRFFLIGLKEMDLNNAFTHTSSFFMLFHLGNTLRSIQ